MIQIYVIIFSKKGQFFLLYFVPFLPIKYMNKTKNGYLVSI